MASGDLSVLAVMDEKLVFFSADDGIHGRELWVLDLVTNKAKMFPDADAELNTEPFVEPGYWDRRDGIDPQTLGSDPGDLTVVGFDDTALAGALSPALTTVRQPIATMAATAVDRLLEALRARQQGNLLPVVDEVVVVAMGVSPRSVGA